MLAWGGLLIVYWALLGRLAGAVRTQKPVLFDSIGSPPASDYLTIGFFVGDGFVTKLEARSDQLTDCPAITSLMRWLRSVWAVQLVLLVIGILAIAVR